MKKPKTTPAPVALTDAEELLARDFVAIHLQQQEIDAQLAALKPQLVALLKAKGNFVMDGHTIKLKRRITYKHGGEVIGLQAQLRDLMKKQQAAGLAKATLTEFPEVEPLPAAATPKPKRGLLSKLTGGKG